MIQMSFVGSTQIGGFWPGVHRVTWAGPVVQEITTVKAQCGGNLRESRSLFAFDPVTIIAPF
jgi:hypothetical protein